MDYAYYAVEQRLLANVFKEVSRYKKHGLFGRLVVLRNYVIHHHSTTLKATFLTALRMNFKPHVVVLYGKPVYEVFKEEKIKTLGEDYFKKYAGYENMFNNENT